MFTEESIEEIVLQSPFTSREADELAGIFGDLLERGFCLTNVEGREDNTIVFTLRASYESSPKPKEEKKETL